MSKRTMKTAWTPNLPGVWVPRVHGVTADNEIVALVKRSLGPTPRPDDASSRLSRAFRELRRVASRYGGSRWGLRETAQSYSGALRRRYLEAERSLLEDGPLSSSDYFLRSFLKAEKRGPGSLAKPRLIFPRSPRYNLVLASWLKPFEHWLWGNLKSLGSRGVAKTRVSAKGLNPNQRARLIRKKFFQIDDCVVFEVDGKAFEAHLDLWQLVGEHSVYKAAYPGDVALKEVLSHQLRNKGATASGVKFSREGGRASGDFNTGMGNTIVMLAVIDEVMRHLKQERFDSLVDGDNALLFLPRSCLSFVVDNFASAATFLSGHEMTLERPVDYLEGIRFGQSAPVFVGHWTMVRDWVKVLSTGTSSHRWLNEPGFVREWLRGVALCEGSLSVGVPILQAWCKSLQAATDDINTVRFHPHRDYEILGVDLDVVRPAQWEEPSLDSRLSFFRAFGVDPETQKCIESYLLREPELFTEFRPAECEEYDVADANEPLVQFSYLV